MMSYIEKKKSLSCKKGKKTIKLTIIAQFSITSKLLYKKLNSPPPPSSQSEIAWTLSPFPLPHPAPT